MTGELHLLLIDLIRFKPRGWSVVRRGNQIQIRPRDRESCKFVVRRNVEKAGMLTIGRYDRLADSWGEWFDCPPEPGRIYESLIALLIA